MEQQAGRPPVPVGTEGQRVAEGLASREKMKLVNDLLYLNILRGNVHFGRFIRIEIN